GTAPSFTSTPIETATEGVEYRYDITATDPNGDPLVITAPTLPDWLTFTDNGDGTAVLTGTPTENDLGEHDVRLEATDGTDIAVQLFTITALDASSGNNPPAFTSDPVTEASEGAAYAYDIAATDDDGDPLTITAPTLPDWLTFEDNGDGTASLTGSPAAGAEGEHDVVLEVSDGTDDAMQAFTITVAAASSGNTAPEFTSTAVLDATEDEEYSYEITATDDDGDALEMTAPTLPGWLTLTDNGDGTATLSGTPGNADVGEHSVALEVSDGSDTGAQEFTITVEAASDPAPNPPPQPPSGGGGGGSLGLLFLLALSSSLAVRRHRQRG
ncbi:MAG: putative Ig domain-containing protein, partial [Woeseia sp.]